MDVNSGKLFTNEEMERCHDALLRKFLVPIDPKKLTTKQEQTHKVSLHDHRSPLGQQLTNLRKVSRNEPCPCGSGKKYKFCHMNV